MLLSSPDLRITFVDPCVYQHAIHCFDYLSSVFEGRIEFVKGYARPALSLLADHACDLVYLDGGKNLPSVTTSMQSSGLYNKSMFCVLLIPKMWLSMLKSVGGCLLGNSRFQLSLQRMLGQGHVSGRTVFVASRDQSWCFFLKSPKILDFVMYNQHVQGHLY